MPVEAVDPQRLRDDLADRHAAGWRTCVRILEDDLHLAADLAHLPTAEAGDVAAVEDDLALGGLRQLQDRAAERGLPAAGLAGGDKLARADAEIDKATACT